MISIVQMCFVAVIALGLFQEGISMKCFQCTSPAGGNCDKPFKTSTAQIQECTSQHAGCALLNVSSNGHSEIRRECAEAHYCSMHRSKRDSSSFARSCTTCSWNLCNSAPTDPPSMGIIVLAAATLVKYYL